MATVTSDLTSGVIVEDMASDWTLISSGGGGQNAQTRPETDDYIQGNDCVSRNPWSSSIRGMVLNVNTTVASGDAVFIWSKADVAQALATKAAGGIQACIGNASNSLSYYYVNGNDDAFGGWKCYVIDPTIAGSLNGVPSATDWFGVRWNIPASGPSKGYPFKIDAIRHGRFFQITGGSAGTPATAQEIADWQGAIARQWGQFQDAGANTFLMQGGWQIGTSATSVYFEDTGATININQNDFVNVGFNRIEINNASSTVILNGYTFNALGTTSPGDFEVVDNATVTINNTSFNGLRNLNFLSNTTLNGPTFKETTQITPAGATINGGSVLDTTSTTGAIVISSPAQMAALSGINFDGNNRCIEITAAGTYSFDGHIFGSGNTITVNNSSGGAVIIQPTNSCDITQGSVETTAGGSTTVEAISTNFNFTVNPLPSPNYEWRIYTVSAIGSLTGAVELTGAENATVALQSYNHTFTNQAIAVQIISDDYVEAIEFYTLTSTAQSQTINLETDDND